MKKRTDTARASRLRVLYYLAYSQRLAGADRSLLELITNLPDHIEPVVAIAADGMVAEAYREAGIEPIILEPKGQALNQYGKAVLEWSLARKAWVSLREYVPYAWRLAKVIRETGADLVHTNEPRGTFLIGPPAYALGRPIVGHLRGELPFGPVLRRAYEAIPSRFIAVSKSTKRHLNERARPRSVAVYNGTRDISEKGTPIPWLRALQREGVAVVTCFASLTPFKGAHHLLHAVARLNEEGYRDRAAFVFLGDHASGYPDYVDWVLNLKRELNVDNFTFAGWQDDPFGFYQSSDATVLPSVSEEQLRFGKREMLVRGNEGFPRTHLEAMCFGLPIVGTDIAGVHEQVEDGKNGFVVPPSDPGALADALKQLIDAPDMRTRMGRAGKERVVERFSTTAYVRGVVDVYEEVARQN